MDTAKKKKMAVENHMLQTKLTGEYAFVYVKSLLCFLSAMEKSLEEWCLLGCYAVWLL
jgi:hypothetical protein